MLTALNVSGQNMVLTLSAPYSHGQTMGTLCYTNPVGVRGIQDGAGNELPSFSNAVLTYVL